LQASQSLGKMRIWVGHACMLARHTLERSPFSKRLLAAASSETVRANKKKVSSLEGTGDSCKQALQRTRKGRRGGERRVSVWPGRTGPVPETSTVGVARGSPGSLVCPKSGFSMVCKAWQAIRVPFSGIFFFVCSLCEPGIPVITATFKFLQRFRA